LRDINTGGDIPDWIRFGIREYDSGKQPLEDLVPRISDKELSCVQFVTAKYRSDIVGGVEKL
jgi:hypothetical protein